MSSKQQQEHVLDVGGPESCGVAVIEDPQLEILDGPPIDGPVDDAGLWLDRREVCEHDLTDERGRESK